MHLRESEQIVKTFHHHPTPFAKGLIFMILGSFPFFLMVFFIADSLSTSATIITNLILFALFGLIIVHYALIYWLDRLIITSQRVIYVNWITLFNRDESEAELNDIQEIATKEKGIFSALRIFDYGEFRLETASTRTTILFDRAPDPEGIRQFLYEVKGKFLRHKPQP